MMYIEQRLSFFREMIGCCHALYLWKYDRNLNLLESNCPEEALLHSLLTISKRWDNLVEYLNDGRKPLILSNEMGLMWITVPDFGEEKLQAIHVLGPFFFYDMSVAQIENELRRRKLSADLWQKVIQVIRALPVIAVSRTMEYTVMLHFCITGDKLDVNDIRFLDDQPNIISELEIEGIHGTYEVEKEMVRLVREGDLDYKKHMKVLASTGRVGNIADGTPLRQLKNMIIVNITLVSRAAMDGGLPPETAYTLSDRYLQAVEKSSSIQALTEINSTMQEDYVQRVHQYRQNETLSKPIRVCLEQMRSRMEDNISLEGLANEFGYSTYYLSKKFKKETGQTFKDYLRQIRLERAKFLLRTTDTSILEISERLQFCSQSYFADSFRKAYGISPTDYREQINEE